MMEINTQGKSWYIVKEGATIQYDEFDEDGEIIATKLVKTKTDVCVYLESKNVEVEEI